MKKIITNLLLLFVVGICSAWADSNILCWESDLSAANEITLSNGFKLAITGNASKNWSKGNGSISVDGTSYTTLKNSNGAQNTITAPTGKTISAVKFYVTANADAAAKLQEFEGQECADEVSSLKDYKTPTVIEKKLVTPANSVTFTFGTKQVCFVAVVTCTGGEEEKEADEVEEQYIFDGTEDLTKSFTEGKMTFGFATDTWSFKKDAKKSDNIQFAGYWSGAGNPAYTAGTNPTSGSVMLLTPAKTGTLSVYVVANGGEKGKPIYVLEDGATINFSLNGTACEPGAIPAEKVYAANITFPVTANKTYAVFCKGSKMGFYGYDYNYTLQTLEGSKSLDGLVYFNDFNSTEGLAIVGNGEFQKDNVDYVHFGKVFQNDPTLTKAVRKNYLVMPTTCLSGSSFTKQMTIGFWVNKKNATDYTYAPLFSAYAKMPNDNGVNETPMFACEARGTVQVNSDGWCNFDAAQNDLGENTETVDWLGDGNWHYYTITMTETRVIVYIDGDVLNSWSINEEPGQHIAGLFTSPENLPYICLGGNQAWGWNDADPAFAFDDFAVYRYALDRNQIKEIIANKLATEEETLVDYTINYLKGTCDHCYCADTVKTVTGKKTAGSPLTLSDRIITDAAGNKYIVNDTKLPSMILSKYADENVLNVYVHTPRTAEVYINYQFGNNEPTEYEIEKLSELSDENTTDANFSWTKYYPAYKHYEKEDIWYQTRSTDYCHHFTFTDDFTRVYQTIAYTLPDADVVFFTEGAKNSTKATKYSENFLSYVAAQNDKTSGIYVWHFIEPQLSGVNYVDGLNEGAYEMIAKTFTKNKRNIALRDADNAANPIAEIATSVVSSDNLLGAGFILKDNSYKNLIINGRNNGSKTNQSEDFDWIVIKKARTVTCEAVENGTITADKVACSKGMPVKVTLTPAANCKLVSARVYDDYNHTVASVTEGTSFTFTMPADDVRITATFKSTEEARPTQITEVNAENGESAVLYNMAGQRVNANAKGLVIKNGKKAIIK